MGMFEGRGVLARAWYAFQTAILGRRDLYNVFGYIVNPSFEQRYFKYLRQDVAGRIVDAPAAALWTNPPEVISNNEAWNEAWEDLVARNNLYAMIERADKLAGIGRYSILVIGFNDGSTNLDQPVNTRSMTQKTGNRILYLQPYSEVTAPIKTYVNDASSEDFLRPELYEIRPTNEFNIGYQSGIKQKTPQTNVFATFKVHKSRVIHLAQNCLENSVYGSPILERVFNVLDDLLKITGGSAETFWLVANRGLHIDVDKEMEMDPKDADALADEVKEYEDNLRRTIRTRGVTVTSLGSDTPDPTGNFNMLMAILSGATGIPKRILLGAEAGQLASEQDRANWADRVDERRASYGNPVVIFQLIKRLTQAGYLPTAENLEITITWPSAFKMSPLENAQTSAQHARSATNFAKAIETMENLKRGDPGTPSSTGPNGEDIPGKPAVEGLDLDDLVTVPEARKMIGLDVPAVTFDSGEDVGGKPRKPSTAPARAPVSQRVHTRSVTVGLKTIMRF